MWPGGASGQEEHEGEAAEVAHVEYNNEIALFFGGTRRSGETAFTFGFDYGHSISEGFGTGVFFDWAADHTEREFIVGIPLYYETGLGHLVGTLGLGVERVNELNQPTEEGGSDEEHDDSSEEAQRTLALLRLGVQYPTHFGYQGRISFGPQVNLDVTKESEALVFGVFLGVLF
jgi:hypothetical protein